MFSRALSVFLLCFVHTESVTTTTGAFNFTMDSWSGKPAYATYESDDDYFTMTMHIPVDFEWAGFHLVDMGGNFPCTNTDGSDCIEGYEFHFKGDDMEVRFQHAIKVVSSAAVPFADSVVFDCTAKQAETNFCELGDSIVMAGPMAMTVTHVNATKREYEFMSSTTANDMRTIVWRRKRLPPVGGDVVRIRAAAKPLSYNARGITAMGLAYHGPNVMTTATLALTANGATGGSGGGRPSLCDIPGLKDGKLETDTGAPLPATGYPTLKLNVKCDDGFTPKVKHVTCTATGWDEMPYCLSGSGGNGTCTVPSISNGHSLLSDGSKGPSAGESIATGTTLTIKCDEGWKVRYAVSTCQKDSTWDYSMQCLPADADTKEDAKDGASHTNKEHNDTSSEKEATNKPQEQSSSDDGSPAEAGIVAGIMGGVLLLLLVAGLAAMKVMKDRQRKARKQKKQLEFGPQSFEQGTAPPLTQPVAYNEYSAATTTAGAGMTGTDYGDYSQQYVQEYAQNYPTTQHYY